MTRMEREWDKAKESGDENREAMAVARRKFRRKMTTKRQEKQVDRMLSLKGLRTVIDQQKGCGFEWERYGFVALYDGELGCTKQG